MQVNGAESLSLRLRLLPSPPLPSPVPAGPVGPLAGSNRKTAEMGPLTTRCPYPPPPAPPTASLHPIFILSIKSPAVGSLWILIQSPANQPG